MPSSSFFKTFLLSSKERKKMEEGKGIKISYKENRKEKGREALKHFSPKKTK